MRSLKLNFSATVLTLGLKAKIFENLKPRSNDRNMPTQHVATLLGATCCVRLATVLRCVATWLGVVGPNLKMVKFEPTTPNMSQHGGQTHATCCAQQCCDMLRWHIAIVWPGLKAKVLGELRTRPPFDRCVTCVGRSTSPVPTVQRSIYKIQNGGRVLSGRWKFSVRYIRVLELLGVKFPWC